MKRLCLGAAGSLIAAGLILPTTAANANAANAAPSDSGDIRSVATDSSIARDALDALAQHSGKARLSSNDRYRATDALIGPSGDRHVRVDRFYRGLPVIGGDMVVHQSQRGRWQGLSSTLRQVVDVRVRPQVERRAAVSAAKSFVRAEKIRRVHLHGKRRLVVDARESAPRLAWEVRTTGVQSNGVPSYRFTYVDARTGEAIRSEEQNRTAEDGEGTGLYSGTVPLTTRKSGDQYELLDPTRGGTRTEDKMNKMDLLCIPFLGCLIPTPGDKVMDDDNTWGDGTPENRQSAAVDAQYAAAATWDYFRDVHNRHGVADDGKGGYSRVHYGNGYNNAFFSKLCNCMTYGGGDGETTGSFATLDVGAHEFAHGVTSSSANLTYSGESGGLNEATSDIFATLVDFHANADEANYNMGEDVMLDGTPLRWMDDPARDEKSASCYTPDVGDLNVHYSSGVGNHFFYLLAEGSGKKTINGVDYDSPTCDGSTVEGIGIEKAGDIWYLALTGYMTSDTNYAGGRQATIDAATELYGADSAEVKAVEAAWTAVGVG